MKLKKFNNKIVRIIDIDNQKFEGICLYENMMRCQLSQESDGRNSSSTKLRKLKLYYKHVAVARVLIL